MAAGRPAFEFTEERLRQIELLAGYGLTRIQIAAVVGISERTLRAKKHDKKISAALTRGQARAQFQVAKSLFDKAVGGDVQAQKWYEMTRAGRHEKLDVLVAKQLEDELDEMMDRLERAQSPETFRETMAILAGGETEE